jgi:ApaG protein
MLLRYQKQNEMGLRAKLISRKWFIKDGKGEIRLVEGPGVVGQTPSFKSGDAFEYSSFCPLPTRKGEIWGHFNRFRGRKV